MTWDLVVHEDTGIRGLVLATAAGHPSSRDNGVEAANIARARQCVQAHGLDQCGLLVLGSATPADSMDSVMLAGREPALGFIRWIKSQRTDLPVIIISTTPDPRLADFVADYRPMALVALGPLFKEDLCSRLSEFRGGGSTSAKAPALEFDLNLLQHRDATWKISRKGNDPFEGAGILYIDDELLDRVIFETAQLEKMLIYPQAIAGEDDGTEWLKALRYLSADLRSLIFDGSIPNRGCWDTFIKHRERTGGIERTRIRVTVNSRARPFLSRQ